MEKLIVRLKKALSKQDVQDINIQPEQIVSITSPKLMRLIEPSDDSPIRIYPTKPKGKKPAKQRLPRKMRSTGKNYSLKQKQKTKKTGKGWIADKFEDLKTFLSGGRKRFNPKARRLIEQHGGKNIVSIVIARTPLSKGIRFVLNLLSKGKIETIRRSLGYDDLYHLSLILTLQDGTRLRLDKQSVPELSTDLELNSTTQMKRVDTKGKKVSLNTFLERGLTKMGDSAWTYDPSRRNCQIFASAMLTANGMNNQDTNKFIMQKAEELLKTIPTLPRKGLEVLLELVSKSDVLVRGRGRRRII